MTEQQVREIIRSELASLIRSDRFTFEKLIQLMDGRNIQLGITTGSKFGTGTTQRIGFYNTTPIAQRSGADQAAIATTGATNSSPWGYTSAAQANAIVALANELRAWAVAQGFIKGSA